MSQAEWNRDSNNSESITFRQFYSYLFEIADLWTEEISLKRYYYEPICNIEWPDIKLFVFLEDIIDILDTCHFWILYSKLWLRLY